MSKPFKIVAAEAKEFIKGTMGPALEYRFGLGGPGVSFNFSVVARSEIEACMLGNAYLEQLFGADRFVELDNESGAVIHLEEEFQLSPEHIVSRQIGGDES